MRVLNYEIVSESGDRVNEDAASVLGLSAWVIDGATGLTKKNVTSFPSDARWYSQQWNEYLMNNIGDYKRSLKEIFSDGIDIVKERYYNIIKHEEVTPLDMPSAAVAAVRVNGSTLEYYLLGDCSLIIEEESGSTEHIKDVGASVFDEQVKAEIHRIQVDKKASFKEAREDVLPLLQHNRNIKNKENGYWILEFSKEAVEHGVWGTKEIKSQSNLLLMSDGFSRFFDTLNIAKDSRELINRAKKYGLKELYRVLRETEEGDPECLRFPRLNKMDDASSILLTIGK